VQIDHTEVDLFLVDETTREAMSVRPWLTLAIDVCTRMVVGFHLSMDKQPRLHRSLHVERRLREKRVAKRKRDRCALASGGVAGSASCRQWRRLQKQGLLVGLPGGGNKTYMATVGAPRYGGHIERLIGTITGRVHFYPGTTFANPSARQDNDSAGFSAMTFREFECALGWEIAGRYNREIHSALLCPPIAVWDEHEASTTLRMPKDRMAFWASFLPDGGVKVTEARRHAARRPSRERRSMPRERATRPRPPSGSVCRLAS
jgi:putative transposase